MENIDVEQSQVSIQELEENLKNDQLIVSNKASPAVLLTVTHVSQRNVPSSTKVLVHMVVCNCA